MIDKEEATFMFKHRLKRSLAELQKKKKKEHEFRTLSLSVRFSFLQALVNANESVKQKSYALP